MRQPRYGGAPAVALLAAALTVTGLAAGLLSPLGAQPYFGKNQVQYETFDWKVIETEHFRLYYYTRERRAAVDAARLAERAYARLSRLIDYEFRERKPIILFASRTDFAQNNVTGDLGEGTGGVTEAGRQRMLVPLTGDYRSFERVLTHEMVHAFQYDIFGQGRAGSGLETLTQVNPPQWLMDGSAEYLAIGPSDPFTETWMRDAALNGAIPSIQELTDRPDRFFPYRYGQSFLAFIGRRYGDQAIGAILRNLPALGVAQAFERETGRPLDELGELWKEDLQNRELPQVARLQRPRQIGQPLLTARRSGGEIFLAPALSPDGRYIAFLSNGSMARGEVFIDLWLGDARTGKRIKRLVKSTLDPNFEELRFIYSQSAFSPDGRWLAFVAQRAGKDVLYLLDVRRRRIARRIDVGLDGVTGPTWSPDGRRLAFSGNRGGITDLYVVNADGRALRQLTSDRYGDMQPAWSPDGQTIAFASDRGTDFERLRLGQWQIALYRLADGTVDVLPGQTGLNLNPVWSPDGRQLAYISDRTGIQNLFLFDFRERRDYQLTSLLGGLAAVTQYSPALSWARDANRLAFTYRDNGTYTIWTVDDPRALKRAPYAPPALVAVSSATDSGRTSVAPPAADSGRQWARSDSRVGGGFRPSAVLTPAEREAQRGAPSVARLLDSAALALPDTATFRFSDYRARFSPEYVARPSVGYARDNYGRGVFGGTTVVLTDLLGNSQLAFAAAVNGRISEAAALASYTHLAHRFQYSAGVLQQPYFYGQRFTREFGDGSAQDNIVISRIVQRQAFGVGIYPRNRFTRVEAGLRVTEMGRSQQFYSATIDASGATQGYGRDSVVRYASLALVQPSAAYVSDNVLFGLMGAPIMGRRYRFQVEPTLGNFRWVEYTADYRRYQPVIFNTLTIAVRGLASISAGRDADSLFKYIGYPELVRGYDRRSFDTGPCEGAAGGFPQQLRCTPLFGSRVVLGSIELRFPLIRNGVLGNVVPIPPIEGLVFYDAGLTWFGGQRVRIARERGGDPLVTRSLLTSRGVGLRVNLFNFAILRWDYALPLDAPVRRGFWQFSIGPSF